MMKHSLLFAGLFVLFSVSGCQAGTQNNRPDEEPISECFIRVDMEVWEDANGDGTHDTDEGPVAGVQIGLLRPNREAGATLAAGEMATSSAEGGAGIGFIVSGDCDLSGYRIVVLAIPPGYIYPEDPLFNFDEMAVGLEGWLLSIGLVPNRTPDAEPEAKNEELEVFKLALQDALWRLDFDVLNELIADPFNYGVFASEYSKTDAEGIFRQMEELGISAEQLVLDIGNRGEVLALSYGASLHDGFLFLYLEGWPDGALIGINEEDGRYYWSDLIDNFYPPIEP